MSDADDGGYDDVGGDYNEDEYMMVIYMFPVEISSV